MSGGAVHFGRGIDVVSRGSFARRIKVRFYLGSSNSYGDGKQGSPVQMRAKGQTRVAAGRKRSAFSNTVKHITAGRLSDNVFLITGRGYAFPAPESRRKSTGGYNVLSLNDEIFIWVTKLLYAFVSYCLFFSCGSFLFHATSYNFNVITKTIQHLTML